MAFGKKAKLVLIIEERKLVDCLCSSLFCLLRMYFLPQEFVIQPPSPYPLSPPLRSCFKKKKMKEKLLEWQLSLSLFFFSRFYFFILRERGREGEKEGEKHQSVASLTCAPRHVPWPGIKPATFRSAGRCLTNWTTLGRVRSLFGIPPPTSQFRATAFQSVLASALLP